jgi:catechol 2,3-dioxygenase-like lactoylglutathione lyase family enzyme
MTSMEFSARPESGECVAPVMPMRDADATASFYGKLGFATQSRYGAPVCDYLILRRDWVELHFYLDADTDPLTNASGAYVRTRDVDAMTADFAAHVPPDPRGTPRFLPAAPKPWGMRQAILVDLDGNLVQFGAPLDQPAQQPAR